MESSVSWVLDVTTEFHTRYDPHTSKQALFHCVCNALQRCLHEDSDEGLHNYDQSTDRKQI